MILDAIFPIRCAGCNTLSTWLCQICTVKAISPRSLIVHSAEIERVIALADYQTTAIAKVIHQMKYGGSKDIAHGFGLLLKHVINLETYDYIIPIPLHKRRLRWRGYNQAEIIAKAVSKELLFPYCKRYKQTKAQATLRKQDRLTNMQSAFYIQKRYRPASQDMLHNTRCLIVDDVYTTGATTHALAKLLKAYGANTIDVAVIAQD